MIRALLCFAVGLCFFDDVFAQPTLREAVDEQITVFKSVGNDRKPVVYPELAERLEAMFLRYPATHVTITGASDKGRPETGHIYVCGEDIYLIGAGEGDNLVANKDGVFEWQIGHKDGIRIKRNNKDLVEYLYYLTDVSWIMANIYYDYLTTPDQFTVAENKEKNWTRIEFKTAQDGFEAIYVSEKPLWFHGMRFQNPKTKNRQEVLISKPEETKGPPASFLEEFKKVKFENSDLTLRRHMMFL